MNIRLSSNSRRDGGALILTIVLFAFCASWLVVFFVMTQGQYNTVARAQTWNRALTLAEAGVEDALALVNKNASSYNDIGSWSGTAASDGWDTTSTPSFTNWPATGGTIYHMRRKVVSTNEDYYDVYINDARGNNVKGPTIYCVGTAKWISTSTTFSAPSATRSIVVRTVTDGLLSGALVALTTIDFKGQNVTIDSFNSLDALHSDWQTNMVFQGTNYGTYPYLDAMTVNYDGTVKRKANGDVATDGNIINVGNADVYGYVDTAPGGTANISSGGSVGDVNWVYNATPGIEPGYARDDMNYTFPDPVLPAVTWTDAGTGNTTVTINTPGNYRLSGQQTRSVFINTTNVVLYMPKGLKFSGGNVVQINTNSSLTIYTGDLIDTGSGGFNNLTQFSLNSAVYGLPAGDTGIDTVAGCALIKLNGNGAGTGYFYAPGASLQFSGGGSTVYDTVGSYVAKDITLNGHFNFHYDEALGILGPSKGYIPTVWQEIQAP